MVNYVKKCHLFQKYKFFYNKLTGLTAAAQYEIVVAGPAGNRAGHRPGHARPQTLPCAHQKG